MPRFSATRIAVLSLPLVAICGVASAQNRGGGGPPAQDRGAAAAPADGAAQPAAPKMTTQHLLQLWERQSQLLKDLKVSIYRVNKTLDWDDEFHYEGSAAFKTPQLAFLDFKKVKTKVVPDPKNPKKRGKVVDLVNPKTNPPTLLSDYYERIVCTGPEVWHYRFDKKTAYIYPLNRDAQRRGLDEGPLPFLFNMKAQEAMARYQMALQGEDKNAFFVVIKPKLKDDQQSFSTAWVRLDRRFLLPVRITLFSPDNQSIRDFQLSKIEANQGVDDEVFRGVKFKGWTIERNPAGPEDGQADRVPSQRNRAGQAAARGRGFDGDQPR